MIKERVNIATSCDNNYARYVFINIANLSQTLRNRYDVHFYLMHSRILPDTVEHLRKFSEFSGISFHEVRVDNDDFISEISKYSLAKDRERFYDGMCHLWLPDDIERVLYVDTGDILILSDDYPFYFEEFTGKSLLVSTYWKLQQDRLDFDRFDGLWGGFNSGHILIDVAQLRQRQLSPSDYVEYVKRWSLKKPGQVTLFGGDQAFLTAFFAGDIATIEKSNPYNVKIAALNGRSPEYQPKSIHFNAMFANVKPWNIPFKKPGDLDKLTFQTTSPTGEKRTHLSGYENECILKWWDVCRLTPVYDLVKSESLTSTKLLLGVCKYMRTNS